MMRAPRAGTALAVVLVAMVTGAGAPAAETPYPVDLPTVLRLARADNLDVRLAEEKVAEARAAHTTAIGRFLPWIGAGIAWRRHEGAIQAVDGTMLDVDKDSTSIGPTITAQIDLGDALFGTLTARDAIEDRVQGLDAGADDYLVKPFAFAELLARIRALLRRASPEEPARSGFADLTIEVHARRVLRGGRDILLTPREFDMFLYLLRHVGEVVTRPMLARDVWRETRRATPLDNVIDVHLANLRRKIDADRSHSFIQTLRGVGFVLRENPPT